MPSRGSFKGGMKFYQSSSQATSLFDKQPGNNNKVPTWFEHLDVQTIPRKCWVVLNQTETWNIHIKTLSNNLT